MFASLQRAAAWSPEPLEVCSRERPEVWSLEQAGFGLVQAWLQVWLFAEIRARRKLLLGSQAPALRPLRLQGIASKSQRLRAAAEVLVRSVRSQALLTLVL